MAQGPMRVSLTERTRAARSNAAARVETDTPNQPHPPPTHAAPALHPCAHNNATPRHSSLPLASTVGVALRGHPFSPQIQPTGGHGGPPLQLMQVESAGYSLTFKTAKKASCGISTRPTFFIRFLPSFCFSSSLRLRVMSPP